MDLDFCIRCTLRKYFNDLRCYLRMDKYSAAEYVQVSASGYVDALCDCHVIDYETCALIKKYIRQQYLILDAIHGGELYV